MELNPQYLADRRSGLFNASDIGKERNFYRQQNIGNKIIKNITGKTGRELLKLNPAQATLRILGGSLGATMRGLGAVQAVAPGTAPYDRVTGAATAINPMAGLFLEGVTLP